MNIAARHTLTLLLFLTLLLGGLTSAAYAQDEPPKLPSSAAPVDNPASPNTITLPDSGTTTSSGTA